MTDVSLVSFFNLFLSNGFVLIIFDLKAKYRTEGMSMLDFISERGARCLVGRCGSTVSAKDQLNES